MKKKEIVSLYARASKQEQTTEQQIELLKEFCKKENLIIYKIYEEKISGAKTSRPQLDLMLQDMRNKKFNSVVVWKYDRLGRSTIHLLQILEEMKNLGVRLIATSQNIDTATPMGKWFVTNLIALAEMERELIRERTQAKLDYYKKQIKKKGFYITKKGVKKYSLGRQKGSKDKKRRRTSGYINRWINERKEGGLIYRGKTRSESEQVK